MTEPATIKPAGISFIWVLPFLALCLAGFIAYEAFISRPIPITISFADGSGLQAGKTKIKYQGVEIGQLNTIKFDHNKSGVVAEFEIERHARFILLSKPTFWLVKPELSFAGVSGLDTVISGQYIDTVIDTKAEQKQIESQFVASLEAPATAGQAEGDLMIKLSAKGLGSLHQGSPIYYRDIQIGKLTGFELATSESTVNIFILIEQEFRHLVNSNSTFWNASGVKLNAGINGLHLEMPSLTSLLIGGIVLNHHAQGNAIESNAEFKLYENYREANAGLSATIIFNSAQGLQENTTKIRYKGFDVATLSKLSLTQEQTVKATFMFDPRANHMLREGSKFWLVKPQLSLSKFKGLDTIIGGNYIGVQPVPIDNKSPQKTVFTALESAPIDENSPGLHVQLTSSVLPAINIGSPIHYRNIAIGEVLKYYLNTKTDTVIIDLLIEQKYAHIIKQDSRFFEVHPLSIDASLSGVKIDLASTSTLITGAIGLHNPDAQSTQASNHARFNLYQSADDAQGSSIAISLSHSTAEGLSVGMPIKYQGIVLGKISQIDLLPTLDGISAKALIDNQYRKLINSNSKFAIVKPQLGLSKFSHLGNLLTGNYIILAQTHNSNIKWQRKFALIEEQALITQNLSGRRFILSAPEGGVKAGAKIYYRKAEVGLVLSSQLRSDATKVDYHVFIKEPYTRLIRTNTVFWNASGIDFSFKIFGGAQLHTESVDSLLAGGLALATPNQPGEIAEENTVFTLHQKSEEAWFKWQPSIDLSTTIP